MAKKTTLNRSVFFLFLLLFVTYCHAQSSSLFEHFSVKNGCSSERVYDAVQTSDGNLWFSTDRGICRFDGNSFHCFSATDGLSDSDIPGLYSDRNGKLWCWSSSGNIYFFENNRFLLMTLNDALISELGNRIINAVTLDSSGNLLVSTVIPGDIFRVFPGNRAEKLVLPDAGNFSFFVLQSFDKSFVFGSGKAKEENNRLAVFLKEGNFSISLSEKGNFSKSSFSRLESNEYLFAKGQEIIRFKKGQVIQRSFTEKNVQDVFQDSEGKIWVGLFQGGVICYPEGIMSTSGMINYLGNKSVSSILEDNGGNIWFTTLEDGIFYLPVRSGISYSSPRIFAEQNSARGDEKPKAVVSSHGSQLEISRRTDFRIVSTDTSLPDTLPPAIFITGVKILEKDTVVQELFDLQYDKNFLKIYFAGFSFSNPEALKYKYKMKGIDDSWVYTDNTFAQYTTLPAGHYIFSVSAMNKNGVWSDSPASVAFVIRPPFWKTWWFISMVIILLAGIAVSFFFLRVSQIKKREREKAEITRQMANAELNALRAQMNPHFLFNTLSSIQHFITLNETEAALKYLSKFAKLMRRIMDNSRKPVIPVKEELEALQLYLELESLRFKNKFSYDISVDESIDLNDDEIPPMLIQPYIENSILHGLMNLENRDGRLVIEMKKKDGMIICSVQDNGIGREKSREINRAKKRHHVSSGMSIAGNRLEILNLLHGSKLNVNIFDLKNAGNEAAGTRVEVFVPL